MSFHPVCMRNPLYIHKHRKNESLYHDSKACKKIQHRSIRVIHNLPFVGVYSIWYKWKMEHRDVEIGTQGWCAAQIPHIRHQPLLRPQKKTDLDPAMPNPNGVGLIYSKLASDKTTEFPRLCSLGCLSCSTRVEFKPPDMIPVRVVWTRELTMCQCHVLLEPAVCWGWRFFTPAHCCVNIEKIQLEFVRLGQKNENESVNGWIVVETHVQCMKYW